MLGKVYHTYPLSLINKASRGFSTSLGEGKSGSGTDYFDSAEEEIKSKAWRASRASHMENNSKFWIHCTQNITWLKFIWHLQKRCVWLIDVEIQCIFLYNYLFVAKLSTVYIIYIYTVAPVPLIDKLNKNSYLKLI